jgi:hypothetical protein
MIGLPASTFGSSVIEGSSAVMDWRPLGCEEEYLKTSPDAIIRPCVLDPRRGEVWQIALDQLVRGEIPKTMLMVASAPASPR